MPPTIPISSLTHALLDEQRAVDAIDQLDGSTETTVVEGLVELVYREPSALAVRKAIATLEVSRTPIIVDALIHALGSSKVTVRIAAIEAVSRRALDRARGGLVHILCRDSSWLVRRTALRALAGNAEREWNILEAATDPHWRVRHELINVLLDWAKTKSLRTEIRQYLQTQNRDPRTAGVHAFLEFRWTGEVPSDGESSADNPQSWCEFWDWDPAVLARTLNRIDADGRRSYIDIMPRLLGHDEIAIRRIAAEVLRRDGQTQHFIEALALLDEPRHPAAEIRSSNCLTVLISIERKRCHSKFCGPILLRPRRWHGPLIKSERLSRRKSRFH